MMNPIPNNSWKIMVLRRSGLWLFLLGLALPVTAHWRSEDFVRREAQGQTPVTSSKRAPSIVTTSPLSSVLVGTAYSQTLVASGATPITWAVTGGTLPAGLTLGSSNGIISGTPTASGVSTLTIKASNSIGRNSKQLRLTVKAPPAPPSIITTSPLSAALVGKGYSQTLAASGATPLTWAVTSGTLPAGLTFGSSTGAISGTPPPSGVGTLTVTATNAVGSNSKPLSLTVKAPPAPPSI